MTYKQIIIDDYFTERTDEGRGTIGYYLFDDIALIKKIREQNEYIKAKEKECETLASQLDFEVQKKECLEQECEELKTENKKLKEEIDDLITEIAGIDI